MGTLIAPFFNVIALLAALVYFLRKPLADFVTSRHHSIGEALKGAREALSAAKSGSEQLAARLATLDHEIAKLRSAAQAEAVKTRGLVLTAAKQLSQTIVTDANAAALALNQEFRGELRRELADRALARAETRLRDRLTGEDRARFRSEFSSLVEKTQ